MVSFCDQIIARDPVCVLCGGRNPSESVEHIPSRILFRGKHRPKGLEVGACRECQSLTREQELIVALVSRLYPEPSSGQDEEDLRKISASAFRNNPGLKEEMQVDQLPILRQLGPAAFQLPHWDFVRTDGPICQSALLNFGYKLGAVLHYHLTGVYLPVGGAVFVRHYTNVDAYTHAPPTALVALGSVLTLRQGLWNEFDTFRYRSAMAVDGDFSGHIAVFREAFALEMHCAPDASLLAHAPKLFVRYV